jgi:hypothetical protein
MQLLYQRLEDEFSLLSVITQDSYFDQAMCIQRCVSFFQHRFRQSVITDHDDGIKMVRSCAVCFAFSGGKLYGRHVGIMDRAR